MSNTTSTPKCLSCGALAVPISGSEEVQWACLDCLRKSIAKELELCGDLVVKDEVPV